MKILLHAKSSVLFFIVFFLITTTPCYSQSKTPTDYSKAENWLIKPGGTANLDVDVFFVYPTIFFSDKPENMDIKNDELYHKAENITCQQSSVFEGTANIFAPLYRQVSIAVLDLEGDAFQKYFSVAYQDVKHAFLYYLENDNDGRPFFLAGHSQGSNILLDLMKELFDDPSLNKQLVAAYIIGYSVTDDDLESYPWFKIAQRADDTGVIITYNTQSPDATGSPVLLPGANCVNPLIWTTSDEYAAKDKNQGAVFFKYGSQIDKETPEYTDAMVGTNGALIVTTPNPDDFYKPETSFFPRGVFHAYDYNFFYRNLQKNIRQRAESFLAN